VDNFVLASFSLIWKYLPRVSSKEWDLLKGRIGSSIERTTAQFVLQKLGGYIPSNGQRALVNT
jgi:hypothetical protein